MGKITAVAVTLVVSLFFVGLLAPIVNAEPAEVTAPNEEWKVGDKWALGQEQSFDAQSNATVNAAIAGLIGNMTNMTVSDVTVSISAGEEAYILFEVTDETADTYVVSTTVAVKLQADGNVEATGQLPIAGTYGPSTDPYNQYAGIPTEDKSVSIGLGADLAFIVDGTTVFNKTTLAIESIDLRAKAAAVLSFDAKNLPAFDVNDTARAIAYNDYDIDLKTVVTADVSVLFTPALDLFQFPFNVGETWPVDCEANTTGDVGGFIDVTGLTPEMNEKLFGPDGSLNGTGMTGFPVNFDQFMDNEGKFGPYTDNISENVTCESVNNGIYRLSVDDGQFVFYYSPDQKLFSGVAVSPDLGDLTGGVSTGSSMIPASLELDTVSADTASAKIDSISSYQQDVADQAQGKSSDDLTDFFFQAPFIGLILVVVAAIVVGGALFMATRNRAQKP